MELRVVDGLPDALRRFRDASPDEFRSVFLDGEPTTPVDLFLDAGLMDASGRPRVRLFPFHGSFIATDRLDYCERDQVFSLLFEQHYLARNSSLRERDAVLELCSGSGAYSLLAAERARLVVGVDLNPRAVAFSRFNRELNAADRRVEFREGSLFEPLDAGERFDLIVVNPPFEYVPEGERYYLHSDGGEDGLRVIQPLIEDAPRFLAPRGRFEIITHSPGGDDGPALLDLVLDRFPVADIECHILDFDPIGKHLPLIDEDPMEGRRGRIPREVLATWRRSLEERGLTHNFFVFLRVTTGSDSADLRVVKPLEEIEECWRLCRDA